MKNNINDNTRRKVQDALLVLLFLSISIAFLPLANAQYILTENSNQPLENITVIIDPEVLDMPNSQQYIYTEDNMTYNITEIISNIVGYYCSLTGLSNENGSQINGYLEEEAVYHYISTEVLDGIYLLNLYCDYNITTNHTIINISTNISSNETFLIVYSYIEQYYDNLNIDKELIVDTLAPIIETSLYGNEISINIQDMTDTQCIFKDNDEEKLFNSTFTQTFTHYFNQSSNYSINCTDLLLNNAYYNDTILFNETINNSTTNNTNNSSNSTNQIIEEPFLSISINKQNINLGEFGYLTINANNNSNVTITICPQQQGWVQCYTTPPFINETFPKVQVMPYSNKTGIYLVEAIMNYGNETLFANLTFNIVNTLKADIRATKEVAAVNEIITFNATASGGIGGYTYVWTMHDGQKFYGKGAYKNFTAVGDFKETLFVNDSYGNNYTSNIDIEIKPRYTLTIVVTDKKTNSRMKDVFVEIEDVANGTTNSAGEIKFDLMKSRYDIYASKENYGTVVEDIELDSNITLNLNMTFEDFTPPEITLLTQDKSVFVEQEVKLKFKANDTTALRCELYIAEGNYSWFTLKDYGDSLLTNTEYTFEIDDLAAGEYKWRIECTDENGNKEESVERSFIVSDQRVAASIAENDDANTDINRALDKIESYAGPAAEIAEMLGVKKSLRELLEKSNNLERDIHNLAYRRDLDEQGKVKMQEKLVDDIKKLKNSIPDDIRVTGSRTFIKYVKDPDLQELLKEYVSIKRLNINSKAFFEATKRTQNKIVISTTVVNAILSYPDGKSNDITLIKKEISISKPSYDAEIHGSGISFVEVIPKDIVADVKLVNIINKEYTVLKADPIIEFPSNTKTISYYINKTIDLDSLEQLDTIIIDKNVNAITSTTGFSILGAESIKDIDGKAAMIGIIVILIIIYLLSTFDIFSRVTALFVNSKKKISYIRVLINDSLDYISSKDYDRAALVYREIRLNYESSPDAVRKEVYQECYDLCNTLDAYYFKELNEEFNRYIKMGDKGKALAVYQKMEHTFEKFDETMRKDHEKIMKDSFNMISAKSA